MLRWSEWEDGWHGAERVPARYHVPGGHRADDRRAQPDLAPPIRVLPGAPKLLMTMLDDTCFGQLRCDGSPIPPPNLDATVEDHRRLMEGQGIGGPGIAGGRW
jgi:hypothetical protein